MAGPARGGMGAVAVCGGTLPAFAEQPRWHRAWLQGQDVRGRSSLGGAGPQGTSGRARGRRPLPRVPGICLLGSGAKFP